MKNLVFVLGAICLLVVVCKAQYARVNFPYSLPILPVGIESDWFEVTLDEQPLAPFTIALKVDPPNLVFTPSTLHFDPLTQSATFRWNTNAVGVYTVTSVLDSVGSAQFLQPSDFYIASQNRSITLDIPKATFGTGYQPYTLYVESTSEPIQLLLSNPSTSDLSITPSSQYGVIQFTPSTITIPAGSVAGHFTVYATFNLDAGNDTLVSWDVSGGQAYWYNKPSSFYIAVATKNINLPDLSYSTVVGFNSTTLYAYADDFPVSSITVTPSAPETVFSPSTFQFSPEVRVVPFSFVTTTPVDNGVKTVYYYGSGPDKPNYGLATGTLSVKRRSIVVQLPSSYVYNRQTLLSVRVGAPLTQPVTIQFFAANLIFSPTNVTLSGTTLSQTVTISPSIVGPDRISYLITGVEQDYYDPLATTDVEVVQGTFISPTNWYVPSLFVGVESPRIPVRVAVPPTKNVTLTPVCADVVFTPATLTFTSTNLQQYFTVTPSFTNAVIDAIVSVRTLQFIVGGNDLSSFSVPDTVSIVVNRREVLIKWSNQIYDNATSKNLYLKKQYIVWATISHPPATGVTLTPTNPYLSFSPSVLNFGPGQTHQSFVVTVEAALNKATTIDYIIGGPDAGWYQTPAQDQVTTALRPLVIYQAVLAPDTRTQYGYLYTKPSTKSLQQNHVFSFSLSSVAAPDNLVITPKSRHINFNPPSIKLSSFVDNYVTKQTVDTTYPYTYSINNPFVAANFTCKPLTSGLLDVWIELGGNDADYYDIPNDFKLNFNQVSYLQPDTPSRQVNSSSKLNFVGGSLMMTILFFFFLSLMIVV